MEPVITESEGDGRSYSGIPGAAGEHVVIRRTVDSNVQVLNSLFRLATQRVRILSMALDPQLFNQSVGEAAAGFLLEHPGGSITILVESSIDSKHPFFEIPRRDGVLDHINVYRVPGDIQRTYSFNFTVVDGKHFRFEQNRVGLNAVVQCKNSAMGGSLEKLFCDLKRVSDKIQVD